MAAGYKLLPSDTQYRDSSYSAQFDRTGRLVTTSCGGRVRLYAAARYSAPIASIRASKRPYSAAFSPDGTRIAIGDDVSHDVPVLSGSDLKLLFKADTTGIPNAGLSVGWPQDGQYLFAGGFW